MENIRNIEKAEKLWKMKIIKYLIWKAIKIK